MAEVWLEAHESEGRLAATDVHDRLLTHLITIVADEGGDETTQHILEQGLGRIAAAEVEAPKQQSARCSLCIKIDHNVSDCAMIRQCLLCHGWGHLKDMCRQPHKNCRYQGTCCVPSDHCNLDTHCAAYEIHHRSGLRHHTLRRGYVR